MQRTTEMVLEGGFVVKVSRFTIERVTCHCGSPMKYDSCGRDYYHYHDGKLHSIKRQTLLNETAKCRGELDT